MEGLLCIVHPDQPVLGICFATPCEHPSRLLCFLCTLDKHQNHAEDVIELEDIVNFNPLNRSSVWPRDEKGQEIRDAIASLAQIENASDLEQLFGNLQTKLSQDISAQSEDVRRQLSNETSLRERKKLELRGYFEAFFSLESLGQLIQQISNGQMSWVEFDELVNQFITRIHSQEFKDSCQFDQVFKDPETTQLVYYNHEAFEKEKENLLQKIAELKSCFTFLRMNLAQDFIFEKAAEEANIQEDEIGIRFTLNVNCRIQSSKQLKEGDNNIILQFNKLQQGQCLFVGLVSPDKEETNICITCGQLHGTQFSKTKGDYLGNTIKAMQLTLKVKINIQNNIFRIGDLKFNEDFKSVANLKAKTWRLFVQRASDTGQSDVILKEARWKV